MLVAASVLLTQVVSEFPSTMHPDDNDYHPECIDCRESFTRFPRQFYSEEEAAEEEDIVTQPPTTREGWDDAVERWEAIDLLVAVFFLIAGAWLLMAISYSILILLLLRLQARGELDFYEENFGLLVCCNGRIRLNFGFILRRYAIQLEREQQQHGQARQNDNGDPEPLRRVRIMTRGERRCAVERLLAAPADKEIAVEPPLTLSMGDGQSDSSEEGPLCMICLGEYGRYCSMETSALSRRGLSSSHLIFVVLLLVIKEPSDQVFTSNTCSHRFHTDCIMDWLERRNNTECPCCREDMVSDDDVWKIVKTMRKERRKQLRKENGVVHRCILWVVGNRHSDSGSSDPTTEHDEMPIATPPTAQTSDIEEGETDGNTEVGTSALSDSNGSDIESEIASEELLEERPEGAMDPVFPEADSVSDPSGVDGVSSADSNVQAACREEVDCSCVP
jgi:hypothetical protein